MRRWLLALALAFAGCAVEVPDAPPLPPSPPAPGPVEPPPVTPTEGAITEAQFAAVPDAATMDEVKAALGPTFGKPFTAAGFTIWRYAEKDGNAIFSLFWKDGKIDHKGVIR